MMARPMADDGSITHWIPALKNGDSVAAREIWSRYYAKLVGLARNKLRGDKGRDADFPKFFSRAR